MQITKIHEMLLGHFGNEVVLKLTEADDTIRDPFVEVAARKIDKVCLFARVEPVLAFDFCQSITGMDLGQELSCVYHLFSYKHDHTLVLKTAVSAAEPILPSCVPVWPAADWYEREVYDLFGIHFEGHPDLRRLLLPPDWEGYPMRKDYKERPFYNGIPTTRENPLDLLE